MQNFVNLFENYLSLKSDGEIKTIEGGEKFWILSSEELDKIGEDWLITEFESAEDWTSWEMHPNGEEIVYLLSGAADLILEKEGIQKTFELRGKGLVIVPHETWHTAKIFEPSNFLIITLGKETQHRRFNKFNAICLV